METNILVVSDKSGPEPETIWMPMPPGYSKARRPINRWIILQCVNLYMIRGVVGEYPSPLEKGC